MEARHPTASTARTDAQRWATVMAWKQHAGQQLRGEAKLAWWTLWHEVAAGQAGTISIHPGVLAAAQGTQERAGIRALEALAAAGLLEIIDRAAAWTIYLPDPLEVAGIRRLVSENVGQGQLDFARDDVPEAEPTDELKSLPLRIAQSPAKTPAELGTDAQSSSASPPPPAVASLPTDGVRAGPQLAQTPSADVAPLPPNPPPPAANAAPQAPQLASADVAPLPPRARASLLLRVKTKPTLSSSLNTTLDSDFRVDDAAKRRAPSGGSGATTADPSRAASGECQPLGQAMAGVLERVATVDPAEQSRRIDALTDTILELVGDPKLARGAVLPHAEAVIQGEWPRSELDRAIATTKAKATAGELRCKFAYFLKCVAKSRHQHDPALR